MHAYKNDTQVYYCSAIGFSHKSPPVLGCLGPEQNLKLWKKLILDFLVDPLIIDQKTSWHLINPKVFGHFHCKEIILCPSHWPASLYQVCGKNQHTDLNYITLKWKYLAAHYYCPPASEVRNEVANLTERKICIPTNMLSKNSSLCLFVPNVNPNYLRTGRIEWAEIFFINICLITCLSLVQFVELRTEQLCNKGRRYYLSQLAISNSDFL